MELRGRWGRERVKPALGPFLGTTKAPDWKGWEIRQRGIRRGTLSEGRRHIMHISVNIGAFLSPFKSRKIVN